MTKRITALDQLKSMCHVYGVASTTAKRLKARKGSGI